MFVHDAEAYRRAQAVITDMLTTIQHDPEDPDIVWYKCTPLCNALLHEGDPAQTTFEMAGILCTVLHGAVKDGQDPADAWRQLCLAMSEDLEDPHA